MLREDFPLLRDKTLVYLDSAATAQKPEVVIEAMSDFYRSAYANVHRGVYPLSEEATSLYEQARSTVAGFINADTEEIVFAKNTTEAINLVAYSLGGGFGPGDAILTTMMEHHSNFVPWQQTAKARRARFSVLPIDPRGDLDLSRLVSAVKDGVRIVAVTHVSNVLGSVNPIREIAAVAHKYGALVLVDGAQAVPHIPVDVKDLDVDFYVFSGHKTYGPSGIGVLYGRRDLLETMSPFLYGGDMIREVRVNETLFNEAPHKFEAGTPPIAEAVGLARALKYLSAVGPDRIHKHEQSLMREAGSILGSTPGVTVYGPAVDKRISVVSFNINGVHPHDVAGLLGSDGICVRAGHHCAQPLHESLGLSSSVRLSVGLYNNLEDMEIFAEKIGRIRKFFSRAA